MIRITLEGIDGCGKTTICKLLSSYLVENGYSVLEVKEPGYTPVGRKIEDIIFNGDPNKITEFLLFLADRSELNNFLESEKEEYDFVVSDRGFLSTLVYQGYFLKEILDINTESFILDLHKSLKLLDENEYTFVLDVSLETAKQRNIKTNKYDDLSRHMYHIFRSRYIKFSNEFPRHFLIQEFSKPEDTLNQIVRILNTLSIIGGN